MLFQKSKQKLVKDYSILTTILLIVVSLSIYFSGLLMSYKSQLHQVELLAIEESEELYFKLSTDKTPYIVKTNETGEYFNHILVQAYDKNKNIIFKLNDLAWSHDFLEKKIADNAFTYHKEYIYFNLIDNNPPHFLLLTRYPLIENNQFLGEVYVGMDITHWVLDQIRIFFILLIIIFLSIFFVRYVAYKMANNAMIPVSESFLQQKQFIANASHELRTPLSIILSGLTVLKTDDNNKLSDFSVDIIDDIHDESLRMKKLIDNVLLSARNDNNTLKVNYTKINLSNLIYKIYTKFSLLATDKQLTLKLQNIDNLFITADSTHMEQILAILVDNAIKYTAPFGNISIQVTTKQNTIQIAIQDTGQGISKENSPHIFEPFYRADKSRSYYGNGLGLSIAKILADKNHSDILVNSVEHQGSCFTLIIYPLTKK